MELTRWTSADTANQAPKATSPISDSWRTTSKTLSIRPNWLSLPRSPDSLPAADLCFASQAVHVRNYSPTIFFFLLGSVRTQQRCVRAAAAGLPWGFRASSRSRCSTGLACTRSTTCRWSDSRSTRGTEAYSRRNIPSPSRRTSGLSAITRQIFERLGKLFGCSSVKTMTCRTPIGLQPCSKQLAKMFLLQFSRESTTSHSHLIQSPSKRQSRRLKAWITKSLTRRCSQPLADLMTTFDFMKQFPEFATL